MFATYTELKELYQQLRVTSKLNPLVLEILQELHELLENVNCYQQYQPTQTGRIPVKVTKTPQPKKPPQCKLHGFTRTEPQLVQLYYALLTCSTQLDTFVTQCADDPLDLDSYAGNIAATIDDEVIGLVGEKLGYFEPVCYRSDQYDREELIAAVAWLTTLYSDMSKSSKLKPLIGGIVHDLHQFELQPDDWRKGCSVVIGDASTESIPQANSVRELRHLAIAMWEIHFSLGETLDHCHDSKAVFDGYDKQPRSVDDKLEYLFLKRLVKFTEAIVHAICGMIGSFIVDDDMDALPFVLGENVFFHGTKYMEHLHEKLHKEETLAAAVASIVHDLKHVHTMTSDESWPDDSDFITKYDYSKIFAEIDQRANKVRWKKIPATPAGRKPRDTTAATCW